MNSNDPFLTQEWPWSNHIEIRRKSVSAEAAQSIIDIMEGKPYTMKAEDIEPKELRRIARAIMLDHAQDIEWMSIREMTSDLLEAAEYPLGREEEEKVYHMVDAWIKQAKVTIEFEDSDDS